MSKKRDPKREPSPEAIEISRVMETLPPDARAQFIRDVTAVYMMSNNLPPEKYESWMRRYCAKRGVVYPRPQ